MDPILALIAALCGGVVVKVVEWFLNRRSVTFNEGISLRTEMRKEIDRLGREVTALRKENVEWRSKYWDLVRVSSTQATKIDILEATVRELQETIQEISSKKK